MSLLKIVLVAVGLTVLGPFLGIKPGTAGHLAYLVIGTWIGQAVWARAFK